MIERFAPNRHGTDYVVGDIHGCHGLLMAALDRLGFDTARDRLFSVGDLVDRGPDSPACLKLVFEPWFHAVRGNHECLAQDALDNGAWPLWLENGGRWALKEDRVSLQALVDAALARMPYAIEVALGATRIGIVHAEPPDDWRDIEQADSMLRRHLVWARQRLAGWDTRPVAGIDAVIVGHSILERPTNLGNVRYIDTGAFTTQHLHVEPLSESLARLAD
ncbi:metallophosphoesterase [Modicisalibacter coralii]|uniref:metallophosphoesterase n=1 Tax=Modicisalibacter coralii TaxID=2304602 RepID=UPI00100AEF28|nr:metallophosphoesterase [Halomonas coralii]